MTSIFYITRISFFSDKAHVYNVAKTCEALQENPDTRVVFVSTDNSLGDENSKRAFFEKHGIKKEFGIASLNSCANYFRKSPARFINWLEALLSNLSLAMFVIKERQKIDVVYFRENLVILPVLIVKFIFKKPVFFEIHAVLHRQPGQFLNEYLAGISNGIIAISRALKDYYDKFNKNVIVSFCAAAEPERFADIAKDKVFLRKKLGLPQDKIILGYTGNLWRTGNNDSYGLEDIVSSLPFLGENIIFIGVGKKRDETKELEDLAGKLGVSGRILFIPWVPKNEIAKYILSFDILLIPAAGAQIGNSPTKMFEYLVAERPIVAANTEAISEVLINGRNSLLVDYKNPKSWAKAISTVLGDRNFGEALVKNAQIDGSKYTWSERGREIYSFIRQIVK